MEIIKKVFIIIGVVALITIAGFAFRAPMEKVRQEATPTAAPTQIPTPKPVIGLTRETSKVFEEAYMEGCLEGGEVSEGYCSCTFDYLLSELGTEKLLNMSVEYDRTGELTPEMYDAASACLKKL